MRLDGHDTARCATAALDALLKVKVHEYDMENLLKVLKVVNTEKMITYYHERI